VTVIEYLPRLMAGMDDELAASALKIFKAQGMNFLLGSKVQSAKAQGGVGKVVFLDADGKEQTLEAERVLVAVGRKPYTDGLGLQEAGVEIDAKGRVTIDDRFQTSVPGIFAIGDVVRGAMLAHKAEDEGIAAVELMV